MLVNFWNKEELMHSISCLYDISEKDIFDCIESLNSEEYAVVTFCRKTGKRLDKVDAGDISFIGKVVTTVVDDFKSFREYGLIGLIDLLKKDTSIRKHFEENDIQIIPDGYTLVYKGVSYPITRKTENGIGLDFTNAMDNLYLKLYYDKGIIEMFLYATDQTMRNYSTIFYYPQIFWTIDEVIRQVTGENPSIIDEWEEEAKTYILSFEVPFKDLEYLTDFDKKEFFYGSLFESDTYFLAEHYESIDYVPENTWFNIWLINTALNVMCGNICDIYAGLKFDTSIPFEKLTINRPICSIKE